MANKAHLNKLAEGVTAWNNWRAANPNINVDISHVYLVHEVSIRKRRTAWRFLASLISLLVTLFLKHTNLIDHLVELLEHNQLFIFNGYPITKITLYTITRFSMFFILMFIIFSGLESLLNNSKGKLDLRNINMREVNLYGSDLEGVDFRYTDFSYADLRNSNLSYLEAIGTDFSHANLTGACIANWIIDHSTNLNDVKCDYIYLSYNEKTDKFEQRRPLDENSVFTPIEFTQRFKIIEKALETIDLTFTDGIDWNAFFQSFQELRQHYPAQDISIQAIERKNRTFIIRLEVNTETFINTDIDKAAIEKKEKELYEIKLRYLEDKYRTELHAKDNVLAVYREQNTNFMEIIKQLAGKNIHVILQATGSVHNIGGIMSENYNNDLKGANIGNFSNKNADNAKQQTNQYINMSEQKQTLAESAAEIQRLIKQLEQSNPSATESEKIDYVTDETTPSFKRRFIAALQAGSETAIEEFLDNPYFNIAKAIIKTWIKPD